MPNVFQVGNRVLVYVNVLTNAPTWSRDRTYQPGDLVQRAGTFWTARRAVGPTATPPAEGLDWTEPTSRLVEASGATVTWTVTDPAGVQTVWGVGELQSLIVRLEPGAYLGVVDPTAGPGDYAWKLEVTGVLKVAVSRTVRIAEGDAPGASAPATSATIQPIRTTDATPTRMTRVTLPPDAGVIINPWVWARDLATGDSASWSAFGLVRRLGSAAPVGDSFNGYAYAALTTSHPVDITPALVAPSLAACNAQIVATATSVDLVVTGIAGRTLQWGVMGNAFSAV